MQSGASLESLAKGAVKFSRRYSIKEIQDRWYSILYDPVVSAESAATMADFETRATPLPSRFFNFGHSKGRKSVSVRSKCKSVRSSYYAMRKRLRKDSATSMDFNFLVDPENGDYGLNGSEPLPENSIPDGATSNHFSDLDPAQCVFPENMIDGNDAIDGDTDRVVYPGADHPVEDNLPIEQNSILEEGLQIRGDDVSLNGAAEELGVPENMDVDNLIGDDNMRLSALDHVDNDHENLCSEFYENNLFDAPELECGTSFNALPLSPLPEVPEMPELWRTDENIPVVNFQYDGGLKDSVACGLADLSNELEFDDDELFLMNGDRKDGIDKAYYDDLSLLLRYPPMDVSPDQVPEKAETELLLDSHAHVADLSVPCHAKVDDNSESQCSSVQVVHKIEFQMPPSASAKDPHFPELVNGVINCVLNTEDPEVPSNDDVFLPFDVPQSTFSHSHKSKSREFSKSIPSTSQDYGFSNHRASERGKTLMQVEQKNSREPSQMMGSQLPGPVCGSKVKCELPYGHASHTVSRSAVIVSGGLVGNNNAANTTNAPLHENTKEEPTKVGLAKHLSNCATNSLIEKPGVGSNDLRNHPKPNGSSIQQEQDVALSLENHQLQHTEMGSSDVPEEDEDSIESDDDVPYYSDIEAMVRRVELNFQSTVNTFFMSVAIS